MSEKLITNNHIEKLGHTILEIRERALNNIISKLNHGFIFDNELGRSKEILSKLFEWFLYKESTQHDKVLQLMRMILQSPNGKILINHFGTETLNRELESIRSQISPKYYNELDEIYRIINSNEIPVVPPLDLDMPFSSRVAESTGRPVGTTATTIEGYVTKIHTGSLKSGQQIQSKETEKDALKVYIIYPLKWQSLIDQDRHVLQSVENSLRNSQQTSEIINSIDFFNNVLIYDFPAEVFLQRPDIFKILLNLLYEKSSSDLVKNHILNSLLNLTKNLKIRVNHYNDPCLYDSKNLVRLQINTTYRSNKTEKGSKRPEEDTLDSERSRIQQLTLPKYCNDLIKCLVHYLCDPSDQLVSSAKSKTTNGLIQESRSVAAILLNETTNLLCLVLSSYIWNEHLTPEVIQVLQDLDDIQLHFSTAIDYFKIQMTIAETDITNHSIQLVIFRSCCHFLKQLVPLPQAKTIMTKHLKITLSSVVLDIALEKFHPDIYYCFKEYLEHCGDTIDSELIIKFKELHRLSESISKSLQFLKNYNTLDAEDAINYVKYSMPYLEYHKDLKLLKYFIEICCNKLPIHFTNYNLLEEYERIITKLLAHNSDDVKKEMYELCHDRVVSAIGPKLSGNGIGLSSEQIIFLLRANIWIEIAMFGLTNESNNIANNAADILIYILKSNILVSDKIWETIVDELKKSLPILVCFASTQTSLGKTLINILDPDTANNLKIPLIEVVKGNIQMLFSKESNIRDEAFARLCWLLTSQSNSKELLPNFNTIYAKTLPDICYLTRSIDLNKNRNTQHFYQPSSVESVLELLKSKSIEPGIRRSALTQMSVMLEDSLLHYTFIQENGLEIVLNIANSTLYEKNYSCYPDTVVPIINVLKNLCLFQTNIRDELSNDIEIYYLILRALILFRDDERLRSDGSTLLFLLIANSFITGTPSRLNFSIPNIFFSKLSVPFICQRHWKKSRHYEENYTQILLSDKYCKSSLEIQWYLENYGFQKLLVHNYDDDDYDMNEQFQISVCDMNRLKGYSFGYSIEKYINEVQNSTTPEDVMYNTSILLLYVFLCDLSENENLGKLLSLPWEATFGKYLKILPSSLSDMKILTNIFQFLHYLSPLYKKEKDKINWLLKLLKSPSLCVIDLINIENNATETAKILAQSLLSLISKCAYQEQHFFNFYYPLEDQNETKDSTHSKNESWKCVIETIIDKLKFGDTTHFYNLSYLDSLLSCLVHLTSSLGWSLNNGQKYMKQLISCLCQMIVVFHNGKGQTISVSVMGLSITRHIVLILNQILAELNYIKLKNWEQLFIEIDETDWLKSFLVLAGSRDTILRAATLQLFAGFAQSARLSVFVITELKDEKTSLLEFGLKILLDNDEASLVRENAALLLANLINHTTQSSSNQSLIYGLLPKSQKMNKNDLSQLFETLDSFEFYKKIISTFDGLYTNKFNNCLNTSRGSITTRTCQLDELGDGEINFLITPSCLKAIVVLFNNLFKLDGKHFAFKLHENGLIKYLFRCLCGKIITNIKNTKQLSVYCEILEMNTSICLFLKKIALSEQIYLGTLLYTKDCMHVLIGLLNLQLFDINLPSLIYLRNRLWSAIYQLLTTLTMTEQMESQIEKCPKTSEECLLLILHVIEEEDRKIFLETLCESIQYSEFEDLQISALTCIISLLNLSTNNKLIQQSLTTLINSDISYEIPLSTAKSETDDNISSAQYEMNLIRSTIFDEMEPKLPPLPLSTRISPNFGVTFCKILLKLYDLNNFLSSRDRKKTSLIVSALSSFFSLSADSKLIAVEYGLLERVLRHIKEIYLKLSLDTADNLRATFTKRRNIELQDLNAYVGLLTNLSYDDNENIKICLINLGFIEIICKLWDWFCVKHNYLVDVLKLLFNFTNHSKAASHTLSVVSNGFNKTTILQSIINLIEKQMDQISKTHNLDLLNLAFLVLTNCCAATECRVLIIKTNLLHSANRLHPAITKKQKPWAEVEDIWLEFLQSFTLYPEGQNAVAKMSDVFDIIIVIARNVKYPKCYIALQILRNITFHQMNRSRLLMSGSFIELLQFKLEHGNTKERSIITLMIWALVANNQRAKVCLKSARIDKILCQVLKHYEVFNDANVNDEEIQRMRCVLNIIRSTDNVR